MSERHRIVFEALRDRRASGRLVLLLVVALLALVPLAYASPPDQTWLGGWYDDTAFISVCVGQ